MELRVATYNIKAGSGGDNVLDPDRTAAAIAETGADGSNGYRLRAWKTELATLGVETGLSLDPPMIGGCGPSSRLWPEACGGA